MRPEFTSANAVNKATRTIAGMLVNLRGVLAYVFSHSGVAKVNVMSLQRAQRTTYIQVVRLNAVTRQAYQRPRTRDIPCDDTNW